LPHEFHKPNTRIGQNFLVDRNILRIILDHGDIGPEDSILEVGAGKGILPTGLL
jgi:16S rRNA (adenine1518-N6/adenine1519-N6)-dimethyltransferase